MLSSTMRPRKSALVIGLPSPLTKFTIGTGRGLASSVSEPPDSAISSAGGGAGSIVVGPWFACHSMNALTDAATIATPISPLVVRPGRMQPLFGGVDLGRRGAEHVDRERSRLRPVHAGRTRRHARQGDPLDRRLLSQQALDHVDRNVPFDDIAVHLRQVAALKRVRHA